MPGVLGLVTLSAKEIDRLDVVSVRWTAEISPAIARRPSGVRSRMIFPKSGRDKVYRRLRWWVRSGWIRTASRPTKTSRQVSKFPFHRISRVRARRQERAGHL